MGSFSEQKLANLLQNVVFPSPFQSIDLTQSLNRFADTRKHGVSRGRSLTEAQPYPALPRSVPAG
jgi:hypothetical protein